MDCKVIDRYNDTVRYPEGIDRSASMSPGTAPGPCTECSLFPARGFAANLVGSVSNGIIAVQTATAAPSGGYVIFLYGRASRAGPRGIGSVLNADSPGGTSGKESILDVVDPRAYLGGMNSLAASTVSTP